VWRQTKPIQLHLAARRRSFTQSCQYCCIFEESECTVYRTLPKAWPPNSPDINPMDYAVWGLCSSAFIFDDTLNLSMSWNKPWHWNGDDCLNASSNKVSLNGDSVYGAVVDKLNIYSSNYVFTSSFSIGLVERTLVKAV